MIKRSVCTGQSSAVSVRPSAVSSCPVTHSPARRRGLASVAIVIVLLLCMLFIIGLVYGSARDQDLSLSGMESIRALYAAEAGANMAIRELMLNADADGDGGIGTISDDDDDATNPTLLATHFNVEAEADGSFLTLTSRGRSGRATRAVQILLEAAATEEIVMTAYGPAGNAHPGYRIWSGGSWSDEEFANSVGGIPRWLVLRGSPNSSQFALATLDQSGTLNVQLWNGSSWGEPDDVVDNAPSNQRRAFDMAYEQQSGHIVLAYGHPAPVSKGRYNVYDGTEWSAQDDLPEAFNFGVEWMKLSPRQESNEILVIALRGPAPGPEINDQVAAALWTGDDFIAAETLTNDAGTTDYQHIDAAFESTSGNALVVYSDGATTPRYRTLTDGVWSAQLSLPDVEEEPHWMRLVANPHSDEIILGVLDANDRLHVNVWDGSEWGDFEEIASSAGGTDRRGFDIAFFAESDSALLAYHTGGSEILYRVWDGSSWSSEEAGPSVNDVLSGTAGTIQARPGEQDGEAFVVWVTSADEVRAAWWDGESFAAAQNLTDDASASAEYETFMIDAAKSGVVIVSWGETEPW